jgi:D-alanyl-D-alanine carboxypeptidase (penicillin-binding protein 5/6)
VGGGQAWAAPRAPGVTCEACIVVDDDGAVLFARRPDARLPMASTTKMVTGLLVVEKADLEDQVIVSANAASIGGGGLDLQAGESYTVEALLYALLLSSSNESAVALAEHVEGSEAEFVGDMNQFVDTLGADDTAFVTSHGLDMPGHFSSARDLADIAAALLDDPVLAEIVATGSATIEGPRGAVHLDNRNSLLESYKGAVGVKTGYTLGAGNVLVGAARRRGRLLISVAMDSVNATTDTQELLDYGFARLRATILLHAGDTVGGVIPASGPGVAVVADKDFRGPFVRSEIEFRLQAARSLATISAGEQVGQIVVLSNGRPVGEVAALAAQDVARDDVPWIVELLLSVVGGFAGLVGRGS